MRYSMAQRSDAASLSGHTNSNIPPSTPSHVPHGSGSFHAPFPLSSWPSKNWSTDTPARDRDPVNADLICQNSSSPRYELNPRGTSRNIYSRPEIISTYRLLPGVEERFANASIYCAAVSAHDFDLKPCRIRRLSAATRDRSSIRPLMVSNAVRGSAGSIYSANSPPASGIEDVFEHTHS